jgi:hypothetical protein
LLSKLVKLLTGDKTIPEPPVEIATKPKKQKQSRSAKSAKDLANERNEPYIAIISIDLDPDNIGAGAFELDWNDRFLAQLVRSGYQLKPNEPENVIVDRWFQQVCRNVVLETYEQEQADPEARRIVKRNLGSGRSEIS